jgi:hypothetical protein
MIILVEQSRWIAGLLFDLGRNGQPRCQAHPTIRIHIIKDASFFTKNLDKWEGLEYNV